MEFKEDRISYIKKIIYKFAISRSTSNPTATAERCLDEALRHIVHVVSRKEYPPTEGPSSCDLSTRSRAMGRKQCLKKIYDQLCWMERKRLYDSPSDNEIGHYLLIKKYTRLIMAFHVATTHGLEKYYGMFGCHTLFMTLHFAEQLMEINQHLADLSEFLLDMNFEDGKSSDTISKDGDPLSVPKLTPWMGTKHGYGVVPVICGSKDRNYMVYYHKFMLALADLSYSEFAFCPPLEDEEKSYVQAWEALSSPSIGPEDDRHVGSEELLNLYLSRLFQGTEDIQRHFAKIRGWILKNLSLTDWWDDVEKTHKKIMCDNEYWDHKLAVFRKELADRCEVSNEDLPDYISKVDHFLTVALLVEALVLYITVERPYYNDFKGLPRTKKMFEWEIIHTLTLFKHGCSSQSVLQEQPILRNLHKFVPLENHHTSGKCKHVHHGKGQDENVIILESIINDLRRIEGSYTILDDEEMTLVRRIWERVSSATHFFVGVMAYEQRKYIIQHYDSFDFSILEFPTEKPGEVDPLLRLEEKNLCLEFDVSNFSEVLNAYKIGLVEKLRSS